MRKHCKKQQLNRLWLLPLKEAVEVSSYINRYNLHFYEVIFLFLFFPTSKRKGSNLLYVYVFRVYSLESVAQIWTMVLMWLDMGLKGALITGL